jgi:hypothetical protein
MSNKMMRIFKFDLHVISNTEEINIFYFFIFSQEYSLEKTLAAIVPPANRPVRNLSATIDVNVRA